MYGADNGGILLTEQEYLETLKETIFDSFEPETVCHPIFEIISAFNHWSRFEIHETTMLYFWIFSPFKSV